VIESAKALLRSWFGAEGQEAIRTPSGERARFRLEFDSLEVGTLELSDDVWRFRYSDAFREQHTQDGGVHPLVDFPDVSKVYQAEELWPFFMARIPSPSQPRIMDEIQRRGLDQNNAPELLRAFGEWSIANPFRLLAA
jgi:hypothetical protein